MVDSKVIPKTMREAKEMGSEIHRSRVPLFQNIWHVVGNDVRESICAKVFSKANEPEKKIVDSQTDRSIVCTVADIALENRMSALKQDQPAVVQADPECDKDFPPINVVDGNMKPNPGFPASKTPKDLTLEKILSADVEIKVISPEQLVRNALKAQLDCMSRQKDADFSQIPHFSKKLVAKVVSSQQPSTDINGDLIHIGHCRRSCANYLRHNAVVLGKKYDKVTSVFRKNPQDPEYVVGYLKFTAKIMQAIYEKYPFLTGATLAE